MDHPSPHCFTVNLPEVSKGPAGLRLRGPPHLILLGGPGLPGKAPLCVGVFSTVAPTGVAPQGLPVPVKLLLGGGHLSRLWRTLASPGLQGTALPAAFCPNSFQLGLGPESL